MSSETIRRVNPPELGPRPKLYGPDFLIEIEANRGGIIVTNSR